MFKVTQTHNHISLLTQPREGTAGNLTGETMPQAAESPWEEGPEPPEFTYHVTLGEPSLSCRHQLRNFRRTVPLRREDESPGARKTSVP